MNIIAEQLLKEGNYQQLASFYEEAIENDPSELSHYWYLSLAYLLQEQEEEAQGIWLLVFSQIAEEDLQDATAKLINILHSEATRQTEQENYQMARLIRHHIKELSPIFLDNLLHLIELEIYFKTFQPSYLTQWQIIELLENNIAQAIDENFLAYITLEIAKIISSESIKFVDTALSLIPEKKNLILNLIAVANKITVEQKIPLYSADLSLVCLNYDPDNLEIIKESFYYHTLSKKYQQCLELAEIFEQHSKTTPDKFFANYQKLSSILTLADWSHIPELYQNYKQSIKTLEEDKDLVIPQYLVSSLINLGIPLLFLEDNPRENRPLHNYLGKLFQRQVNLQNSPVSTPAQPKAKPEKLRIGYIGHTLKAHSVGWLSRWLFKYHNKDNFEIGIYLVNQKEDYLTQEWFKPSSDFFYNFSTDIPRAIAQIQRDEINILVDLDSMTLDLTCRILALKPAPIQVTWLGLDASGLPAIDYFIADPYVLPENAQSYYHEKIWRLPNTYLAVDGFEVGVPTRRREDLDISPDAVIYLNIQQGFKRNPLAIRWQMRILKAVNNSYLMIKGFADPEITKNLYTQLAFEEGVNPDRLRFLPQDQTEAIHRANLAIADVILDTYPYNGATTTLEVLWMGVPLVTRVGEQFASRNSYTFMVNAGLNEGIAFTDEEYIYWGVRFGTDEALREQVKTKLRRSRSTSPLWNAREFTREMEKAYQQMWAKYCQT